MNFPILRILGSRLTLAALGLLVSQPLRAEWRTCLDGQPAGAAIHQCGSGVTACHNLLALAHAGLGGGRLYPGSWSEWCANPARPVATGA